MPPELWGNESEIGSDALIRGDSYAVGALALALLDPDYAILDDLVLPEDLPHGEERRKALQTWHLAQRLPDISSGQILEAMEKGWGAQVEVLGLAHRRVLADVIAQLLRRDPARRLRLREARETLSKFSIDEYEC